MKMIKRELEISFFFSIIAHILTIFLLVPTFLGQKPSLSKAPSIIEVEVVKPLPKISPVTSPKNLRKAKVKTPVFKPALRDIAPKRLYVAGPSLLNVLTERQTKSSDRASLIHEEPSPFDFEEKIWVGGASGEILAKSEIVFNKEVEEEWLKGHKEVIPSSLPSRHKEEMGLALKEKEGELPYLAQISTGPVAKRKFYWHGLKIPEWVEERGISLRGELKFWVFPDGSVDPNIQIKETTSYPEVDRLFSDALKRSWFSPINEERKEWGVLSFKIELK